MSVDEYMMELPLDANDVPIRVGDVVYNKFTGDEYEVAGVGVECFFAWRDSAHRYAQRDADAHVHRKRELEDVLRECIGEASDARTVYESEVMDMEWYERELERLVEKYAEEIRGMKWT